ncbi:MAG: glycosyltransferase [Verrucomicrobiales bacterium]|nr:glycosyltransferase [Verrucomicrobiales bacterium]
MPRIILLFLKLPVPGSVKTRLAAGLSGENPGEQAADIYRRLVDEVLRVISVSEWDELRICFEPPDAEQAVQEWLNLPKSGPVVFQGQFQGDLGERLEFATESAFSQNPGGAKLILLGTDCIEISPDTFSRTWSELDSHDLVFGPTNDGGYYLAGLNEPAPEIFTGIPWSTEHTLSASLETAKTAGRKIALLETLNDVDTAEDWDIARTRIDPTGSV